MAYKTVPNVGLTWISDADPTVMPGVPAPAYQFLIRTDSPSLYYKSGPGNTDWTALGGGGPPPSSSEGFQKVLDGTEGDVILVTLPTPWPDTDYNPTVTLMRPTGNALKIVTVLTPSITVNDFQVELSADAENGDVLLVEINAI